MTYNDTFKDRLGRSNVAKQKALELLKARPKQDEAELAARKAARLQREAADAEARAAKKAAAEQAKREAEEARLAKIAADEAAAEAAREKRAAAFAMPTAEERKAARDAKYAARKARQK